MRRDRVKTRERRVPGDAFLHVDVIPLLCVGLFVFYKIAHDVPFVVVGV